MKPPPMGDPWWKVLLGWACILGATALLATCQNYTGGGWFY